MISFKPWIIVVACTALVVGCKDVDHEPLPAPWWEALEPEVVIDNAEFYSKSCAITQVTQQVGTKTEEVVFEVPYSMIATCRNIGSLKYDGEYIILEVCEMSFGAGGCSGGLYRSADLEYWEEYIGVTWINSEEYEAWREVGSTSAKADSVKKVVSP